MSTSTTPAIDGDRAWRAVAARDAAQAGRFVYAVVTTGVYCRPGCASRLPRRENVRFFSSARAAGEAGFRACRRCRPDLALDEGPPAGVEAARRHLEAHRDSNVTLTSLSNLTGMSASHLHREFKRILGVTPNEYLQIVRADRLKAGLHAGHSVTRAMNDAGYSSPSRLYDQIDTHLAMTPSAYRKRGAGERVAFATCETDLGVLLVAATDRGVCAIKLGDDRAGVEAELRTEFARADIRDDDSRSGEWLSSIVTLMHGTTSTVDLPLDLQATAFQLRVWRALREIPFGSTRSYAEVAADIGRPSAVRAVASACARNPLALVIPCHRVLRSDGTLGGYRWGEDRKRELLDLESGRARHES